MIAARWLDRVGSGSRRMDEFPRGLPARPVNSASRETTAIQGARRRAIGEKGKAK